MEGQPREEYVASLRRRSSGFARGVSKYRGVARFISPHQSTTSPGSRQAPSSSSWSIHSILQASSQREMGGEDRARVRQ